MAIIRWLIPFVLFLLCGCLNATAQTTDQKLAAEYFDNAEFDKAEIYYKKLYTQVPSNFYFQRYYQSVLNQNRLDDAEKILKKQIKRDNKNPELKIMLGELYKSKGLQKDATKQFENVIKDLEANSGRIVNVARKFVAIGENDYALRTYAKGKELINGFYTFNYEIAELYGQMGRYEEMVALYIEMIEINPGYLQTIQNAMNRNFDFEEDSKASAALQKGLLKKIQQDPDEKTFSELLIWIYLQQKNYYGALIQTKALDKRLGERGTRLMSLGNLLQRNKEYDLALEAFQASEKSADTDYKKLQAQKSALTTENLKLTESNADLEQWQELNKKYLAIADKNDWSSLQNTVLEYAEINAYRLDDLTAATQILEQLIKNQSVKKQTQAKAKIALGDYYLIQGEIWEAALLYGQAEKMFPHSEIGEQAKFKNGKVGYYTGDFDWAKAQLNVLKGSTSKLIANDALYLSILITDNSTVDTTIVPMQEFAKADLLKTQRKYQQALDKLADINKTYPGHSLADDIQFQRYKIYMELKDYGAAATSLESIVQNYSEDLLGDEALFYLGEIYADYLNDETKAKQFYQDLLLTFPSSVFTTEARKRFRILRGDQIN